MFVKTRNFFALLKSNTSGVALIEFAYVLPIVTAMTFGGLEIANLAVTHFRVSQIANMVADNAARVRDRIDETDINEDFTGAKQIGESFNILQKGRIMVSLVEDNAATTSNTTDNIITWQRCKGMKTPPSNFGVQGDVKTDGIGPTGQKISATPGNPLVFVEVYYEYTSVFPLLAPMVGTQTLRYATAYSVRDRMDQTLQNAQNLSGANTGACNLYNAT